ncbi:MAG: hypothetical protein Q9213_005358 [Squamulea squamosa]
MSAREIREFNPNIHGLHYLLDGALDPDDSHIFPLVDPPRTRLSTQRNTVVTDSSAEPSDADSASRSVDSRESRGNGSESDRDSAQRSSDLEAGIRTTSSPEGHHDLNSDTDFPTHPAESSRHSTSSSAVHDNDAGGFEGRRISNTGSGPAQRLVTQWLSKCQSNEDGQHNHCNRSDGSWLPTRLLDIRHALETAVLRLVSPARTPDAFVLDRRHITLSHCWGKWVPEGIPVLNLANVMDRYDEGIALEQIPPTFKHAIQVADWFKASQMHEVYKQGFLNISADSAADARGGLFNSRAPLTIRPLKLHLPGIDETIYLTLDERNMFQWVNDAPLSTRAWVFQERQLARRVLHFTKDEIVWGCRIKESTFASETFPSGAPLRFSFNNKPKIQLGALLDESQESAERPYRLWEDLCKMYSELQLTKPTDKLIALAGLAKEFEKHLPNDSYVVGMWRSTLP